jgi:catechol 2,3-dioxygenase-like lactoylglutathione lyase family enzyme
MPLVHHCGLWPADLDASLRFYVDGIGLDVLFDVTLKMDMEGLLGERTESVRTIFLGSKDRPQEGIVELLDLGTGRAVSQPPAPGLPGRGMFLVSFQVPVEPTLARLADLGLGGPPRKIPTGPDSYAATVVDPDGVMVELLDKPVTLG